MKFNRGEKSLTALQTFAVLGFFILTIRFLLYTNTFHSGLLYIAYPFLLSVAIYYFTPHTDGSSWMKRFWNNLRLCLIQLLAVSVVTMEGYVCILMFLPIFFFITLLTFFAKLIDHRTKHRKKGKYYSAILPSIILILSMEGVTETISFNRYNEVTYSQVIPTNVHTIKEKLTQPIILEGKRHWLLSVFPMPEYVSTVSMTEGDARKYHFVYHRWFVTNTHIGDLDVIITSINDHSIKTTINDSSYISNYMTLHGTEFTFEPIDENQTYVSMTVRFDRLLDPFWYFEPLERFAVRKGAEYFLNEVLI